MHVSVKEDKLNFELTPAPPKEVKSKKPAAKKAPAKKKPAAKADEKGD